MESQHLVWLITGTSYVSPRARSQAVRPAERRHQRSGFGRELALQILERGDRVIATARARSFSQITDLKAKGADTFELDVTAPLADLHEFAKNVVARHGRVDVLVNNAGALAAKESLLRQCR